MTSQSEGSGVGFTVFHEEMNCIYVCVQRYVAPVLKRAQVPISQQ